MARNGFRGHQSLRVMTSQNAEARQAMIARMSRSMVLGRSRLPFGSLG
ncbi:hypothetical protein SEA_MALIBO_37 [Gordonia phage Malibo]|nr:hypothetical protein SEA_MALIBO_37 [Gordonia phage Malibo]